ncbi:MAG: CPBP family intramembrane metalloprotease [Deltaproteobacteria bacterium]|nr:CPBP family intramembrane metalloprotease [Deltaproteobacteria bacterium]
MEPSKTSRPTGYSYPPHTVRPSGNTLAGETWTWWEGAVAFGIFILAQLLAGAAMGVLIHQGLLPKAWMPQQNTPIHGGAMYVLLAASSLLTLALLVLLITRRGPHGWAMAGFTKAGLTRQALGGVPAAILGGMLIQVAAIPIEIAWPPPHTFETQFSQVMTLGPLPFLGFALLLGVLIPLVEEITFRGVLFPALQRPLGGLWAAGAVSLLFTLLHYDQWESYPFYFILIFSMAMVLAWLRYRSGGLWQPWAFHAGINLTALGAAVAASG